MSVLPPKRRQLPLVQIGGHGTGRSRMTCKYRCGDACFHDVPNRSGNAYFGDIAQEAFSRRSLLKAGAVVALVAAGTTLGDPQRVAATTGVPTGGRVPPKGPGPKGLRFAPITQQTGDTVAVPKDYLSEVVISWGDPLWSDAPAFDPHNQTAAAQQRQFGYNNDHTGILEGRHSGTKSTVLVCNHEYSTEPMMLPGYDPENPTLEQVEIGWAAHGLTVVAVEPSGRRGGKKVGLKPILDHALNRRFHTRTEFELTGPVAGSRYVQTTADRRGRTVLGTLNNCAGGVTPWGTWLTAEENFNQYFANADGVSDPVVRERLARYGLPGGASERRWEDFDDRFDLTKEPNEVNRFGWIVEVDPFDPTSTPKKRTALGRFKHEAATIRISDEGYAVAYMGDDERFDYLYKFVSSRKYRENDPQHNAHLLEDGTLYVARFTGDSPPEEIDGSGAVPSDGEFDGSGEWIKLVSGPRSFVPGMSAEEVLLFTRQAGDIVGATKMDRPEDVEPSPVTGKVYMALTNNTARTNEQADEANPRGDNKHGHVMELTEAGDDAAATSFGWKVLLLCGDPDDPSTYFAGFDKSEVSPISCPDNVAFDRHGNLWISTDGQPGTLGTNDALYGVPVEGEYRGWVRQFLAVPGGGETCGPIVQDRMVLVAVQHPGEFSEASFENPLSHWPDGGTSIPRPSIVVAYRGDGGMFL